MDKKPELKDACRVCEAPIPSAELCADCAKGNDPFHQSKYSVSRTR